jgi:hypothetical protein
VTTTHLSIPQRISTRATGPNPNSPKPAETSDARQTSVPSFSATGQRFTPYPAPPAERRSVRGREKGDGDGVLQRVEKRAAGGVGWEEVFVDALTDKKYVREAKSDRRVRG